MNLEMVARTIQLIIAPAVMITSCCILTNGLLAHSASIGERLRVTVRERVDLLRETNAMEVRDHKEQGFALISKERLEDIDAQIPNLLQHHHFMRTSLAGTFIAVTCYIFDMFVIAFSVLFNQASLYSAIVIVFLLGVACQLTGVLYSLFDTFLSHKIYAYESLHALFLEKSSAEHIRG